VAWQLVQATDDVPSAIAAQKRWVARSIKVGPPDAMSRVGIEDQGIARVTEALTKAIGIERLVSFLMKQ
jgi:hypothetical protein